MGEEMSLHSGRSKLPVRLLLAAGVMALAAAGCASQGTTPGQAVTTGALGSQTLPSAGSATSPTASAPASSSDSAPASDQDSSSAPASSDTSSAINNSGMVYKVTDTVTEGGFKFKIRTITLPYTPPAGSTFKPGPTRAWLVMDYDVTNVSNQQLMFSTLGAFDLRDSTNASYITSVAGGDSLPAGQQFQDHEMKPGESAHGAVVFDVPQSGKGYRLIYKGNMWQDDGTPPSIMLGR